MTMPTHLLIRRGHGLVTLILLSPKRCF